MAAAAGEGQGVEAAGAEEEERRGGAEKAEVEVAQAAGNGGVVVAVPGRWLRLHEGREERRHRRGGKGALDLYLFPPFNS